MRVMRRLQSDRDPVASVDRPLLCLKVVNFLSVKQSRQESHICLCETNNLECLQGLIKK